MTTDRIMGALDVIDSKLSAIMEFLEGQRPPQRAPAPAADQEFVPIKATKKFNAYCSGLLLTPGINSDSTKKVESLMETVEQFKQLTIGQWKMLCGISKSVTRAWPPGKEKFLEEDPLPVAARAPARDDDIPF